MAGGALRCKGAEAKGVPAAGRQLWLAAPAQWELKVAQTRAEAGSTQFRLYCKGPQAAVPAGAYLIADGAAAYGPAHGAV